MIDQPALRRILAPRRPSLSKLPRLIAGEKPSCLISIPGQAHPVDGSSWIIFPTHSPERIYCSGSARPDRACWYRGPWSPKPPSPDPGKNLYAASPLRGICQELWVSSCTSPSSPCAVWLCLFHPMRVFRFNSANFSVLQNKQRIPLIKVAKYNVIRYFLK